MTASLSSRRRNRIVATPRARRAMTQLEIDPTSLRGTGPRGRIVEADARAFRPPVAVVAPPSSLNSTVNVSQPEDVTLVQVAPPTHQLRAEVDVTRLLAWRAALLSCAANKAGARFSLSDVLLQILAASLRACPCASIVWQNGAAQPCSPNDIGIVLASSEEEKAPRQNVSVVSGVNRLNLLELAQARRTLVTATAAGKSSSDDVTESAATALCNARRGRVDELCPALPYGMGSVLGVGAVTPRAFAVESQLQVRPTLRLCLVVDARVLDWGTASRFLGCIIERIEEPELLILG